jgi:hypothetical protein
MAAIIWTAVERVGDDVVAGGYSLCLRSRRSQVRILLAG